MNKLLVALCVVLSGFATYGNASVNVVVSEETFDHLLREFTAADPYVVVVVDEQFRSQPRYILHHNGFYFTFRKSGIKTFTVPGIILVPATAVIDPMQ